MEGSTRLDRAAKALGYAGLLPQAIAAAVVLSGSEWRWVAAACAFAYAALIFSFLGGVWWGAAVQAAERRTWVFVVAVAPSLVGLVLYFPWTIGWEWPGPALLLLGPLIGLSPLVDRALRYGGGDWLALRRNLSLGLGALTLLVGIALL